MTTTKTKEQKTFVLNTFVDIEQFWLRLKTMNLDFKAIPKEKRTEYINKFRPGADIEALKQHYKQRKAARISVKSFIAIEIDGIVHKFYNSEDIINCIRHLKKINMVAGYILSNKESFIYEHWTITYEKKQPKEKQGKENI